MLQQVAATHQFHSISSHRNVKKNQKKTSHAVCCELARPSLIVDFVPGAQFSGATWRITVNNSLHNSQTPSLRLYLAHFVKTWRPPRNREYVSYCIVVRGGPSHGVHVRNMYRKFREVSSAVFQICWRTDRHKDTLIAMLRTPPVGEVKWFILLKYHWS